MVNIGIVGAGVAGLHLGLLLQKHGITATIYAEKAPEQQLAGRLSNIVIRSAPTRERERVLGVNHWDAANVDLFRRNVHVGGERPFAFSGDFAQPAILVDMRIYYARLLEDFAMRGGRVVVGALQAGDVERLSAEHDLMVVASGRGSLANMFPRIPEHSPYSKPNDYASRASTAASPTHSRSGSTSLATRATATSSSRRSSLSNHTWPALASSSSPAAPSRY
jgi:hypothetical protein